MNPLQTHRNRYGQYRLPVFVPYLDGDFATVIPWQQVTADGRCCLCGFSFRHIKVREL
jgi:hypothetical protein